MRPFYQKKIEKYRLIEKHKLLIFFQRKTLFIKELLLYALAKIGETKSSKCKCSNLWDQPKIMVGHIEQVEHLPPKP